MKRMRLTIILLILTFGFAFCQPDKTFKEVVTFEKGFRFSETGQIQLQPYLGSTSDQVEWANILNKPAVFPPDLNITNPLYKTADYVPTWDEVQGKPEVFPPDISLIPQIELQLALEQLGIYLGKTTTELNAITPANGFGIALDITEGVYKIYSGGYWKTVITGN